MECKKDINQSLYKALSLLEYFTKETPFRGISEISKLSSIPKATVYRLFNTFEQNGYLRKINIQGKSNQYGLGMKFLQLSSTASGCMEIQDVARPFMEELRNDLNEDVQLVIKDGRRALYVEKIRCTHPVRLYTQIGKTASLNAGACPRAILSFLEDDEINDLMNYGEFKKYTEHTVMDEKLLWERIQESRKKGYTISFGEMEPQTVGVAVPIFDHLNRVVGAVSTAGPDQRFHEGRFEEIIKKTKDTGSRISKAIGFKKI